MFRGEKAGPGTWPAIIDRGQWDEVQQIRTYRASQTKEKTHTRRFYLLRGVVMCTCGVRMGESKANDNYIYRWSRNGRQDERSTDGRYPPSRRRGSPRMWI